MKNSLEYYEKIAKDSKTHHWVPQCYLNNFSISKNSESVFFYTKNGTAISTGTKRIAAENDLYTFQNKDTGEQMRAMEGIFSEHEGEVSPILKEIIKKRTLPINNNLATLSAFVSTLIVRGPSFSEWLRNMDAVRQKMEMQTLAKHPESLRARLKNANINIESEEEFEDLRKSLLDFDAHFTVKMNGGEGHYFKEAMELSQDMHNVFLQQKSWHLLVTNGKKHFITSDNPVAIQRVKELPLHLSEGFGYGTILLTLSPDICLVLRSIPLSRAVICAQPTDVAYINKSIMRSARRQIYAHISSKTIQSSCNRFLNGGESDVFIENLGRYSPYLITKGIERDAEADVFVRYSVK